MSVGVDVYPENDSRSSLHASPSLAHVLQERARRHPERLAFRFLGYGAAGDAPEESVVTYGELERNARAVAALVQGIAQAGDRALLVYPTGPDYVAAFFGCLFAQVVAVPAYPPEYGRMAGRLETMAVDCTPTIALTTRDLVPRCQSLWSGAAALRGVRWTATDDRFAGLERLWRPLATGSTTLAFLQYTSGSSGDPKGVMVSHGNLVDNLERLRQGFGYGPDDHHVTWLPPYHDMGLIAALLSAIYTGHACTVMSPFAFLQDPFRWLSEVSRRRGTVVGAPNFAYELCVRKIPAERARDLDLGSLRVAFCGAEPVRPQTMRRFIRHFAAAGLEPKAFRPAYGMAEATVFLSTGPENETTWVLPVAREAYARGEAAVPAADAPAVEAVSCGRPLSGHDVLIVDPDRRVVCPERTVGEVWVSGPSVAHGYWGKVDATAQAFQGRLASDDEAKRHPGPFLRTGDLAFVCEGQLFIAGRLKDLIIVRGVNHYPQDIELTVEASHRALRPGCGAAFSVDDGNEERVVVLHELGAGQHDTESILAGIRRAIRDEHQIDVGAIVLIEPNTLPKTTSGKIARRPSRSAFVEGRLRALARWES
jgi:acyl-CoA synthetase (AMP-forming)/AMP-acid ligase II